MTFKKEKEKVFLEVVFEGTKQPVIKFHNVNDIGSMELRFVVERLFFEWREQRKQEDLKGKEK